MRNLVDPVVEMHGLVLRVRVDLEIRGIGDRAIAAGAFEETGAFGIGVEIVDDIDPVGGQRFRRQGFEPCVVHRRADHDDVAFGWPGLQDGFRLLSHLWRSRRLRRRDRHHNDANLRNGDCQLDAGSGGGRFRLLRFRGLRRRRRILAAHACDLLERVAVFRVAQAPVAEYNRRNAFLARRFVAGELACPGKALFLAEQVGGRLAAVLAPVAAPVDPHVLDLRKTVAGPVGAEHHFFHVRSGLGRRADDLSVLGLLLHRLRLGAGDRPEARADRRAAQPAIPENHRGNAERADAGIDHELGGAGIAVLLAEEVGGRSAALAGKVLAPVEPHAVYGGCFESPRRFLRSHAPGEQRGQQNHEQGEEAWHIVPSSRGSVL